MPLSFKDRVKQAVTTGGSGALVIGAAASGFQALAAGDDAGLFPYVIEDGTAWETGYGTYTHSGTSFARTTRTASSTGSALTVSTSAFFYVDIVSNVAKGMHLAAQAPVPPFVFTLTSGNPYPSADVTGTTTGYWTPCGGNVVELWDGNIWVPVTSAELSLAWGTTSVVPHDIFVSLSGGAAAIGKLAWTNATTRATGVSYQDGRRCKIGAKDQLLVATVYPSSTTTLEDSEAKPFIFNEYNRVPRIARGAGVYGVDATNGVGSAVNLSTNLDLGIVLGASQRILVTHNSAFNNTVGATAIQDSYYAIGIDGVFTQWLFSNDNGEPTNRSPSKWIEVAAGYHTLNYGWAYGAGGGLVGYAGGSRGSVSSTDATSLQASILR